MWLNKKFKINMLEDLKTFILSLLVWMITKNQDILGKIKIEITLSLSGEIMSVILISIFIIIINYSIAD